MLGAFQIFIKFYILIICEQIPEGFSLFPVANLNMAKDWQCRKFCIISEHLHNHSLLFFFFLIWFFCTVWDTFHKIPDSFFCILSARNILMFTYHTVVNKIYLNKNLVFKIYKDMTWKLIIALLHLGRLLLWHVIDVFDNFRPRL